MPIQGLIPETKGSGLPRIGKFHKGTPKQIKTRPDKSTYEIVGKDTDYFRVTFNEGYDVYSQAFEDIYGPQPRSMLVKLNAQTVHDVFDFWREEWDAAETLLHRCDGKQQAVTYNRESGYFEQNQHLCAAPRCGCVSVARLELILPEFFEATGVLGTFTLETHSEQDIRVLYARLTSFQVLLGGLAGVPFYLYREVRETGAPEVRMIEGENKKKVVQRTGKRLKVPRAMIDINIAPDFVKTNLSPALIGTAFSTISPLFEAPKEHPVLVAATHRDGAARLALGSGPKRLGQSMETVEESHKEEVPAAPKKTKPDWWNPVIKTLGVGKTDEEYTALKKDVKALIDDGALLWDLSEKDAYDEVVRLIVKPQVDALLIDEDAARFAAKDNDNE